MICGQRIQVHIKPERFWAVSERGVAHVLERGTAEDQRARGLLLAKYAATEDSLDEWGRISLPVMVEFPDNADEPNSCCAEQALSS